MNDADQWTVRRVLEWTTGHLAGHGSTSPRLDAEILLAHSRGCQRIELYTRFDEPLSESERAVMRELVQRRAAAEPVAYLVGRREFFGLDFRVTPDVFIPRPETETLVVELLAIIRELPAPNVLDLCTGSGCIAIAAAANCPQATITAVDLNEKSLDIARQNAATHGVNDRIRFLHGDLFAPVEAGRFDVVVSNPPYVAETEIDVLQPDVGLHEPRLALAGGPDGLDVVRRIVAEASSFLAPGGSLLLEISPEQAAASLDVLESHGYVEGRTLKDLSGNKRILAARKPG